MTVALWAIGFTIVYIVVTVVALALNEDYDGPKIPNVIGLPIMIILYFFCLPHILDLAKGTLIPIDEPAITSYGPTPTPSASSSGAPIESTESKLRRVYDSHGIQHDDRMIKDDARAVERLSREFGN